LPPQDLVNVSGATWVDERLVAGSIAHLDRALQDPYADERRFYAEVSSLLRKGYLRCPGDGAIRSLRWLPACVARRKVRRWLTPTWSEAPHLPTQPAALTLSLCICIGERSLPGEHGPSSPWQALRELLAALHQTPQVRITVGWTLSALRDAQAKSPDLIELYCQGVARGQIETVQVLAFPPLALMPDLQMLNRQLTDWQTATANRPELTRAGLVFPRTGLVGGWGDVLRGHEFTYVVLDEADVRRSYPLFEHGRPISVEGWTGIVTCSEAGAVLGERLPKDVLLTYLDALRATAKRGPIAVRLSISSEAETDWLSAAIEVARRCGHVIAPVSAAAEMQSQGVVELQAHWPGAVDWVANEARRDLNARVERLVQAVYALQALAPVPGMDAKPAIRRLGTAYALLSAAAQARSRYEPEHAAAAAHIEQATEATRRDVQAWLRALAPLPPHSEDLLGTVRIYQPRGEARRITLLELALELPPHANPEAITFVHADAPILHQLIGQEGPRAEFWLAIEVSPRQHLDVRVYRRAGPLTNTVLDVTTQRLCNPWTVVLLDEHGQITSLRFQGREHLLRPGNLVRGYLLQAGQALLPEICPAQVQVESTGPLVATVCVRQQFPAGVTLLRRVRLAWTSPMLDFTSELWFPVPQTLADDLIVGLFSLRGCQVAWPLPLQAGRAVAACDDVAASILSPRDVVDVSDGTAGIRYMAHRLTTPTVCYRAISDRDGLQLGLIATAPTHARNLQCPSPQTGLGFPGFTYCGRYTYRYALIPMADSTDTISASYNHPPIWAFYPAQ